MVIKFVALTEQICHQLKAEGFLFLAVSTADDEDIFKRQVILKPLKTYTGPECISLDDSAKLINSSKCQYHVMIATNSAG